MEELVNLNDEEDVDYGGYDEESDREVIENFNEAISGTNQ